ncbi:RcnB family protein [Pseudomonas sp. 21TX0197]|uniref:RcnB family protein n=1 Tax=Pseudomonas sp. 21TX0197 TaxID=2972639 RepID=UPI002330607D|nr:RcnB family protein [Pseudomonas sp. 21TX0197]MDB6446941.1 RcnB family protein [Pseudomonas sp. 21TX0197]
MRKPTLTASLLLIAGLAALGPAAQAVEKTGDALEYSPSNGRRLVENDRVPADYQRADRAVKDWKQKQLEQPTSEQQWVHIDDKYLLIETVSGAIVKIVPATR